MKLSITGLFLSAFCSSVYAASAADWRSRSIYQVLTDRFALPSGGNTASCDTGDRAYCGGTWQGLIKQLDYIKNMGFTAVWISPVTLQLQGSTGDGTSYHGYWQQDLYQVNSKFGTAADLKSLASALHDRGMYLMVDIVVNHNGWNGAPSSVDYTKFNPFNSASDYHPYCTPDYNNENSVQTCWQGDTIVPLPDLKTESANVASGYQDWIAELVSNYSIDGLRMDTARQVDLGFWKDFESAAGVFMTGEIYDGDPNFVCPYQNYLPSVLNYPMYYQATAAFSSTSGNMAGLVAEMSAMKSTCKDVTVLGSFTENHDNPRFAYLTGDMSLAKNIISFTLLADGIPILYQGQEQHYNAQGSTSGGNDPFNREAVWLSNYNTDAPLYQLVAMVNSLRNHAIYNDPTLPTQTNTIVYSDTTTVAMKRGSIVAVLSNKGANGAAYTQAIPNTGFTGQVTEVLSCTTLTASSSGSISVPMAQGLPRIYHETSSLSGSGICGH